MQIDTVEHVRVFQMVRAKVCEPDCWMLSRDLLRPIETKLTVLPALDAENSAESLELSAKWGFNGFCLTLQPVLSLCSSDVADGCHFEPTFTLTGSCEISVVWVPSMFRGIRELGPLHNFRRVLIEEGVFAFLSGFSDVVLWAGTFSAAFASWEKSPLGVVPFAAFNGGEEIGGTTPIGV